MSDIADAVGEAAEHAQESKLNAMVALFVAITATFMALCNVKDGNVVQNMAVMQSEMIDSWSYYQAKSTKQSLAESVLDQLSIMRDTQPGMAAESRAVLEKKIADYTAKVKRYDKEKEEIKKHAESLKSDYDGMNLHDDQFDMGEACMSIAIALFGVTALTQRRWLFVIALVFAGFGIVLGLAGFLGWTIHPDFLARLLT